MRYKVSTICTSCSHGFCTGGFSKPMNKTFQECQEVGLRRMGIVQGDQPLCACLWRNPEGHNFPLVVTEETKALLLKA